MKRDGMKNSVIKSTIISCFTQLEDGAGCTIQVRTLYPRGTLYGERLWNKEDLQPVRRQLLIRWSPPVFALKAFDIGHLCGEKLVLCGVDRICPSSVIFPFGGT